MGAGSSGNRPTEKPIAKTRTLKTITANMTGARFSAPGTPYCIGSVASTPAARPRGMVAAKGEVFEHQTAARPKQAKHGSEPEPKQVKHGNQVIAG